MRIAIVGYGKMGKAVEEIAVSAGHEIVAKIDSSKDWSKLEQEVKLADVAIEFSTPQTVFANIKQCFALDLPVVTGTTSWEAHLDEVKKLCETQNQSLLVASNFSLGVNVFYRLSRDLSAIMNKFDDYEVSVSETHHVKKIDKPSGTALHLVRDLLGNIDRKKTWGEAENHNDNEILVSSLRLDDVSGIHEVNYESDEDLIQIKHTAKNRKGFARGAVNAAKWLHGKKGFFTMDDLMEDIIVQ